MKVIEARYGIVEDISQEDLANLRNLTDSEDGYAPTRFSFSKLRVEDPNDPVGEWRIEVMVSCGMFAQGQPDFEYMREQLERDGWSIEFIELYLQAARDKLSYLLVEEYN